MDIALFSASFLFLRHGETGMNAADLISGTTDVPLNAAGVAQAEAAADMLDGTGLAAIWHSPLARARQTAEIVAARTGVALRQVADLAERNWGGWEGLPRAVLRREETPPGGGEGPDDFAARTLAGLAQIVPPFPVLVVAHSGTARVIAATLAPDRPVRRAGNAEPILWQRGAGGWTPLSPGADMELSGKCQKTVSYRA